MAYLYILFEKMSLANTESRGRTQVANVVAEIKLLLPVHWQQELKRKMLFERHCGSRLKALRIWECGKGEMQRDL